MSYATTCVSRCAGSVIQTFVNLLHCYCNNYKFNAYFTFTVALHIQKYYIEIFPLQIAFCIYYLVPYGLKLKYVKCLGLEMFMRYKLHILQS